MPPTEAEFDEVAQLFGELVKLTATGHVEAMVAKVDGYLAATGECRCVGLGMVAPQFVAHAMRGHTDGWLFHAPDDVPTEQAVMEASVRSYLADDPLAAAARLVTLHDVDGCAGTRGVIITAVLLYVEVSNHVLGLHKRGLRGWLARRRYRAARS
jgi:hypothetical protein